MCVCVCVTGCLSPAVHSRRCSLTRRSDPRPSPRGWGRGEGGGNFSFPAWALRCECYPRKFLGTAGLGGLNAEWGPQGQRGLCTESAPSLCALRGGAGWKGPRLVGVGVGAESPWKSVFITRARTLQVLETTKDIGLGSEWWSFKLSLLGVRHKPNLGRQGDLSSGTDSS